MATNEPPSPKPAASPSSRRRRTVLVYGLFLVSVGFLLWQVQVFLARSQASSAGPPASAGSLLAERSGSSARDMDSFVTEIKAGRAGGLEVLACDSPASPPAGATSLWSLGRPSRRAEGFVDLQWGYQGAMTKEALATHYRAALGDAGYSLVSAGGVGGRRLVFSRGDVAEENVLIGLPKESEHGTMRRWTVIQYRRADAGDFSPRRVASP